MTRSSAASVVGRAAGLTTIVLLQVYWFAQPVPFAAKALVAAFVLVSITRPASGLLVFAGLAPLSTVIAVLFGDGTRLGTQLLEQLALGVGAGVLVRGEAAEGRTRIGAPALFMAVVAVASAAAMVPAAAAPIVRSIWDPPLWQQLAARQPALFSPVWGPVFAALVVAECGLLGWAVERTVRREPQLAARLVLIALIGHAGAAAMNLLALLGGALRTGDTIHALPQLLMTLRISRQADIHSAASALVIAGIAGLGLMRGSLTRRLGISLLLAAVAMGLWITGSRVAIVLAILAVVATIAWSVVRAGRHRVLVALLAIGAVAGGTWLIFQANRYQSASKSTSARLFLMNVGLRLARDAPVFGIGITRFYPESAAAGGPQLESLTFFAHENAHNNFIQVLAEEGVVGLGAMAWWLTVVLAGGARAQISKPDGLRRALLLASLTCIATWMTGHPLLVPEFAFVFWFYSGILTALTPIPGGAGPRRLAWVLAAAVILSLPPRAWALRNNADLEHVGFGVSSLWQHDGALPYREAGASFAIYLPTTSGPVVVPIRRVPGAPDPLVVDISIGHHAAGQVSLEGDTWRTALVLMPPGRRRFELVDFGVHPLTTGGELPGVLVRVGKDVAR